MEAKKSGTYWCAKCQTTHHIFSDVGQAHRSFLANKHEISLLNRRDKEKLAAHDAIKRDSTELGATPPVAKGETAALCATPKRVEQQAKNLVVNVLERHRHPCTKCGGEGTVVPEGETEPVACSACHGTGSVKRRQEAVPSNPNFQLRPMTDLEWSGFGGVEAPENGRPLIGDVTLDGMEGVVLVGANSTGVMLQPSGDADPIEFQFPIPYSQGSAIAQQVSRMTTVQELISAGFEKISFGPSTPLQREVPEVKEHFADIEASGSLNEPPDEPDLDGSSGPPEHVQYGWVITWANPEVFAEGTRGEVGVAGPRDSTFTDEKMKAEGHEFQMYDDDGIHYYTGFYLGPEGELQFGPLEDYGTPNAGCTEIRYKDAVGAFTTL
jgi:hypothetical protein